MKLLIAGASGFLGKNLLLHLPSRWEVYGIYNKSSSFPDFVERHNLKRVLPIKCNLNSSSTTARILRELGRMDAALYLASDTRVGYLTQRPAVDVRNNIATLANFLQSSREDNLIYFSSGAVYMGLKGEVGPNLRLDPSIPYAISKFACEQYVKHHQARGAVRSYVVVRFFGAYGRFEPARRITYRLVKAGMQSGIEEFTVYGDGENYIDVMYIDDAVKGILAMLKSEEKNYTVDICFGNPLTINDYVRAVFAVFGKEVHLRHVGFSPEYIEFKASPYRMKEIFGFSPKTILAEGIRKYSKWITSQEAHEKSSLS